jgi:hypothetical protein
MAIFGTMMQWVARNGGRGTLCMHAQ